ncbi:Glucose-1-phosphate adenylyltransferase like protein, partial [Aduncisulcus paluster]
MAYRFKGYWKDVGTVESLWEANMDLIKLNPEFDLHDKKWRAYSVNPVSPPQFISPYGMIESSLINEGCVIEGRIKKSVISPDVYVGIGAHVEES